MTFSANGETPISRQVDAWGRVVFDPQSAFELLYRGIEPSSLTMPPDPRITAYNDWCVRFDRAGAMFNDLEQPTETPAETHARRAAQWFIGEPYASMDVAQALFDRCQTDAQRERAMNEYVLFEARNQVVLLRLAFMLVDHWRAHGVVWGIGRGSACASYCLYLIGLHRVDALRYGLAIEEFLKPE